MHLSTALTIGILARKPKVKALVRVSKDNPNLKRYLAIDLLNSHLKDGTKLSYDAQSSRLKRFINNLLSNFTLTNANPKIKKKWKISLKI
ncbi:MAG: hypothetical protein V8R83_10300 [Candidatus Gastranaerophilaceae bacterium]